MRHRCILTFLLLSAVCVFAGKVEDYADKIAPLIEPAKLSTLGTRGANPRIQKYVYWLATAKADTVQPSRVVDAAIKQAGYTNALAVELTRKAMLRNLDIARQLGCLDAEGLAEMRKGNAATIRRGPYVNDELSVDHIIPRAVVPELDNVIANLELMPLRMNERKNAKVGQRQRALATKFYDAGLLSSAGLRTVK